MHDIARFVGIDRSCLCRIFKAGLGVSPARYLHAYRLKKVAEMMERESLSIHEIALSTGFYDVSHFPGSLRRAMACSREHTEKCA